MPFVASAESIEDKIAYYQTLEAAINNDNLIFIPVANSVTEDSITAEALQHRLMQELIEAGEYSHEKLLSTYSLFVAASNVTKQRIKNGVLPELKFEIESLTTYPNNRVTINEDVSSSDNRSFAGFVSDISSDEYLDTLAFDNVISPSNGGGTAIQDSQMDSFDGNWNEAINDNYSSCPKTKPDDRSSFKAYPNGQTSGGTYRNCAYFKNGYLRLEEPYVNGKKDGLQTVYTWSNKYNFSYVYTRINYTNGKRNGLMDFYSLTKNGAVYRMRFTTYVDGTQHGDSAQWYENGQTMKETNFFQGKATLQYFYRKDGSFAYCTEWRSDRKPGNCKTGKLR